MILSGIKMLMQGALDVIKFLKSSSNTAADTMEVVLGYLPGISITASTIKSIFNHLTKTSSAPSNLQQTLDDFHNPNNRPVAPPKPGNFR
jgi:hypothetical protein